MTAHLALPMHRNDNCSSELIGLYDVIARLLSLTLQNGNSPA